MRRPTDQDLETGVAAMLRFGVSLSALVVLVGGVILLRHPWAAAPSFTIFDAGGPQIRTLKGIVDGVWKLDANSIVQFGLILLIATPVARVIFCVVGFARQRDKLYVVVSALVLMILIYSLSKGAS